MGPKSLSTDDLDQLYQRQSDPWNLAHSPYEAAKYDATLGALPRQRYEYGVEIGCSIGVLTARLAQRCDRLLAIDPAIAAIEQAKQRNGDAPNISFDQRLLPRDGLKGKFDLVVLSEVLYFMSRPDVCATAELLTGHVRSGADLILVNWLPASDLPLDGDTAANEFIEALGQRARLISQARYEKYRLDVLRVG